MGIEKRPDETELEYHKRIIYGKLVDKTLSDMDYTELAEKVYGQPYSSDVARRMFYGSRKTLDLISNCEISQIKENNILNELEMKTIELKKERQRFSDQRREYLKIISADGRKEHLYERLAEAADNLENSIGRFYSNPMPDTATSMAWSENEAVLVLSDWHYGMTADNIFNRYNVDICKERVARVVRDATERLVFNAVGKLYIVILGDVIHGAIHTSARVASEELVCDQIMQASELLAQSIRELSKYVSDTVVYVTYGNHARTVANKNDSIHRDNLEKIIGWWLSQRLKGENRIKVVDKSNNEFLSFSVCGHEFCASHGDLDSVKSSPRLIYTLFQKQYGKDIEYIILGDKHHRESFEELGVTAMLCGSLCGADDYANDKRLFSTPSQMLLIVNKEHGVDAEYRLKCK